MLLEGHLIETLVSLACIIMPVASSKPKAFSNSYRRLSKKANKVINGTIN